MKNKLVGILIVVFLICILFSVLVQNMMGKQKRSMWPQTVNLLCCVLDDFDGLTDAEQHQFSLAVTDRSDSISINKTLVALLQSSTNNLRPLRRGIHWTLALATGMRHGLFIFLALLAALSAAARPGQSLLPRMQPSLTVQTCKPRHHPALFEEVRFFFKSSIPFLATAWQFLAY